MRSIIFLVACLASTSSALARGPEPEGSYLVLDRLSADVGPREVVIDIAVEARSWKWAQGQGVIPLVFTELQLDDGKTQIVPSQLDQRELRLRLTPERGASVRTIDVWLGNAGRTKAAPVRWFELAGARFERVRLAFVAPVPEVRPARDDRAAAPPVAAPPVRSWASDPETIAACMATFISRPNRQKCLEHVATAAVAPPEIIEACSFATHMVERHTLDCLAIARRAPSDPTRTIEACSERSGTKALMACLATAYP